MGAAAIIVAAGRGTRAGGGLAKQWRMLAGKPVVQHAVDAFRAAAVSPIVVVIAAEDVARSRDLAAADLRLVTGGETRDASVRAGLAALAGTGVAKVLIHDGARPRVAPSLIARLVDALDTAVAAAPALAVTDALWRVEGGRVVAPHPRAGLWRAQTPQAYRLDAIVDAHAAHPGGAADDVEVALAAGLEVAVIDGDEENLKITWPGDIARAERMIAQDKSRKANDMEVRTGNGFDVHAFGPGDHVWICGVRIAHPQALVGHSDADVGMHALTDAIYGALAEGDIGRHFPPSDPQWKGAASEIFLRHAAGRIAARGFRLTNADVTLICEAPRIGPHAAAMQAELARILGVDPDRVGVKATTTERLGFPGRGEGIAALATATLVSS
jgi:2-C-methyl-D-erythritol 4-phosphate cytidylyltransferase/2-C-methyl-D-erythritol 2,4-cyclodiphosphate synthase